MNDGERDRPASASASSSPRRCWSAPAPRCRFREPRSFRSTARSSACAGTASDFERPLAGRGLRCRGQLRTMWTLCSARSITRIPIAQDEAAHGHGQRHAPKRRQRADPGRALAADRRGRQVVPAAAGQRAWRARLRRRHRRNRSPKAAAGRAGARRPSPWSTCGSATATASTSSRRSSSRRPEARGIILTGYGNIATAVNAVKLGAVDYLAKPADADDVVAALLAHRRTQGRAAGKSDVGRPRALGAHPAHLRTVRPQRLGDRAPAQHAPPHACSASWPSARRSKKYRRIPVFPFVPAKAGTQL